MEASVSTVDMASVEELEVQQGTTQGEGQEPAFANMTVEDPSRGRVKVGATTDSGVNTDADWESHVADIFSHNSVLMAQYEVLMKQQQNENEQCKKEIQEALSKQEAAKKQHKALLQKLDSVRVKLQLNNSKNFSAKKEEMMLEKNKENEAIMRLNEELDESSRKLQDLTKEQLEEKKKWQDDLAELKQQMEQLKKEAEEAERLALQDEIGAVEQQRDVAMALIQTWQKELAQYLKNLSVAMPKKYHNERPQWEKKEELVRQNQTELQSRCEEVLLQLHQGRELESLPRINVPVLPQIPMAELKYEQLLQSVVTPLFVVPPPPPQPQMFHGTNRPFPPPRPPHFYPAHYHSMPYVPPPQFFPPPPNRQPLHNLAHFPPLAPPSPVFNRPPSRATPPPSISPSPPPPPKLGNPPAPSTPPPKAAGAPEATGKQDKLDKFLEKLGSRFPDCSKVQLKSLLQQVKSSRGTLAGMSMEELVVQVGLRLAKNEGSGTVAQPPQVFNVETRRLCLICQNLVDPEQRHLLDCSHTVHRDCIRTWLETSNSCPFCK